MIDMAREEGTYILMVDVFNAKCQPPCEMEQIEDMNDNKINMFLAAKTIK